MSKNKNITGQFSGASERTEEEQDRINYHEAGHAIIARHCGMGFNHITNIPNAEGTSEGSMNVEGHSLQGENDYQIFLMLMGGLAATHLALDHYDLSEVQTDFDIAWSFFYKIWENMDVGIDGDAEELGGTLIFGAIDDAKDILEQKEWYLHQVAAALKEKQTLSMQEIDEILAKEKPSPDLTQDDGLNL